MSKKNKVSNSTAAPTKGLDPCTVIFGTTGSGKTCSFILPAFERIIKSEYVSDNRYHDASFVVKAREFNVMMATKVHSHALQKRKYLRQKLYFAKKQH